jgi:hypothetical protein
METKAQVTKIFSYLRDIKKLDQKIIRNVNEYENTIWLADFFDADGCNFHDENNYADDWIVIKKQRQIHPKKEYSKICDYCHKPFIAHRDNKKGPGFCSDKCRLYYHRSPKKIKL